MRKMVCPVGYKKVKGKCIPKWEKIDNCWQHKKGKYDFVIEHPRGQDYILSIFKARIKDPDKAFIDSIELPTLASAMGEAEGWVYFHRFNSHSSQPTFIN